MEHNVDNQDIQPEPDNRSDDFTTFVSYSREDARIVEPMVRMLRLSGTPIFRDQDSIAPGTKWRLKIATVLENCTTVIVFWCSHAYYSKEVELEWRQAIEFEKLVVPILLDSTRMPSDLAQYQAIDLRDALGKHEEKIYVGGGEPGSLKGPWEYILRVPSDNELQNGVEYLVAQLHNFSKARKCDA